MTQLSTEQITELLSSTGRNINKYGNYNAPTFEPPVQTGAVRFCNSATLKCQYVTDSPEWSPDLKQGKGMQCNSPCHIRFQGKPMCTVHTLISANKLLIELGVLC